MKHVKNPKMMKQCNNIDLDLSSDLDMTSSSMMSGLSGLEGGSKSATNLHSK